MQQFIDLDRSVIEAKRLRNFLITGRDPHQWISAADRHKRAADVIFETANSANERMLAFDLSAPISTAGKVEILSGNRLADWLDVQLLAEYLLLSGYALECLFKACLVLSNPEAYVLDDKLSKLVLTHDLVDLVKRCGLSASAEENQHLSLLSRYVIWGKYPTPKEAKNMPSWFLLDDQAGKSLAVINPFHDRRAQRLTNGLFSAGCARFDESKGGNTQSVPPNPRD